MMTDSELQLAILKVFDPSDAYLYKGFLVESLRSTQGEDRAKLSGVTPITCPGCGREGLFWDVVQHRYFLVDYVGNPHQCRNLTAKEGE